MEMCSRNSVPSAFTDPLKARASYEINERKTMSELLLLSQQSMNMILGTASRLTPEQSAPAIIVYPKDAKYYSVGESRVEQLMK